MPNSKDIQEARKALPPWYVRWFILFRLYPRFLFQPTLLFNILIRRRRYPVLWDSVMAAEERRVAIKKGKENLRDNT